MTEVEFRRKRVDKGRADLGNVDELAVQFVCNGTPMRLNKDERIVAVQRMLGRRAVNEIARLIFTYQEEVSRIAKATPGTLNCPFCHQRVYADDGVLSRHVSIQGDRWCPQSGLHKSVRARSIESLARNNH